MMYSWHERHGLPASVRTVFAQSGSAVLQSLNVLRIRQNHRVELPGGLPGLAPSTLDIWVLAQGGSERISIGVDLRPARYRGDTVGQWLKDATPEKRDRYEAMLRMLELPTARTENARYQLLHRTAATHIEARANGARHALLLMYSSDSLHAQFDDYRRFVELFGGEATVDHVTAVGTRDSIQLYFAWVDQRPVEYGDTDNGLSQSEGPASLAPTDVDVGIGLGSVVTVRDEDGDEITYTIVASGDASAKQGKISDESPVG